MPAPQGGPVSLPVHSPDGPSPLPGPGTGPQKLPFIDGTAWCAGQGGGTGGAVHADSSALACHSDQPTSLARAVLPAPFWPPSARAMASSRVIDTHHAFCAAVSARVGGDTDTDEPREPWPTDAATPADA